MVKYSGNRLAFSMNFVKVEMAMMNAGTRGSGGNNLNFLLISKLKYTVYYGGVGYVFLISAILRILCSG